MINDEYMKLALKKYPQKCLLINMLSKRIAQLTAGAKPLVDEMPYNKVNIALREIIEDKVKFKKVAVV